jgi:hypothetical protein
MLSVVVGEGGYFMAASGTVHAGYNVYGGGGAAYQKTSNGGGNVGGYEIKFCCKPCASHDVLTYGLRR